MQTKILNYNRVLLTVAIDHTTYIFHINLKTVEEHLKEVDDKCCFFNIMFVCWIQVQVPID